MLFVDLDGTVLSVFARHHAAYRSALSCPKIGGMPVPERLYWSLRRQGESWKEILKRSRLLPTRYESYRRGFEARLEAPELLRLDQLRTGAQTFLARLSSRTPIVLVTQRRDRVALDDQLVELGIRGHFAAVLSGAPDGSRRRDRSARGLHKSGLVRARYRRVPTEALWIGDTETDVQAARSLGFSVWLVEGGHRDKVRQTAAAPDRIHANLAATLDGLLPGGRWQR